MPGEIFYSESDDGQITVAGTDTTPQLDLAAGRQVAILGVPQTGAIEDVRQALMRATPEERDAFFVATKEAAQSGEDIPPELTAAAAKRKDAVKIITALAADKEIRQKALTAMKDGAALKEVLDGAAAEEERFDLAKYREQRDKQERRWHSGVGRGMR